MASQVNSMKHIRKKHHFYPLFQKLENKGAPPDSLWGETEAAAENCKLPH